MKTFAPAIIAIGLLGPFKTHCMEHSPLFTENHYTKTLSLATNNSAYISPITFDALLVLYNLIYYRDGRNVEQKKGSFEKDIKSGFLRACLMNSTKFGYQFDIFLYRDTPLYQTTGEVLSECFIGNNDELLDLIAYEKADDKEKFLLSSLLNKKSKQ